MLHALINSFFLVFSFITSIILYMLSRDYISRIIKTFFEALDEAFNGKKEDKMEIQDQLNDLYKVYFQNDRESFLQNGAEDIIGFLQNDPDRMEKYGMLQELMYRDANIQDDPAIRNNLYRKIIYLCDYINNNSSNFSLIYDNRSAEINRILES